MELPHVLADLLELHPTAFEYGLVFADHNVIRQTVGADLHAPHLLQQLTSLVYVTALGWHELWHPDCVKDLLQHVFRSHVLGLGFVAENHPVTQDVHSN